MLSGCRVYNIHKYKTISSYTWNKYTVMSFISEIHTYIHEFLLLVWPPEAVFLKDLGAMPLKYDQERYLIIIQYLWEDRSLISVGTFLQVVKLPLSWKKEKFTFPLGKIN